METKEDEMKVGDDSTDLTDTLRSFISKKESIANTEKIKKLMKKKKLPQSMLLD